MNPLAAPAGGETAALSNIINSLGKTPAPGVLAPQAPEPPQPAPASINFDAPPIDPFPSYAQPEPIVPAPAAPSETAPLPPSFDPNAIPLSPILPQAQATPTTYTQEQVNQLIASIQAGTPAPAAAPAAPVAPAPWEPQSWGDVETRIQAEAQRLVQQGLTTAQAQVAAQVDEAEKQRVAADQFLDGQVASLEKSGLLPAVVNQNDSNDPGRLARQELYSYALALGTDNLAAVAPTLAAHHASGYFYDRNQNKLIRRGSQTAAAQAPIAGAGPVGGPTAPSTGPSLRDLQTKDLYTLAEEASRAYPNT